MLPKNRFKQPFEFLSAAFIYTQRLMHRRSRSWGLRCVGGRHGTPRASPFGAFNFLGALPRGLDLGTPPLNPLSGKRR